MRVSTCEKCAKGSECVVRKDKTCVYTGTCSSFISYSKAANIVRLRSNTSSSNTKNKQSVIPSSSCLTYKPFANLVSRERG